MLDIPEKSMDKSVDAEKSPQALPSLAQEDRTKKQPKQVVARYGRMNQLGLFRHNLDGEIKRGEKLVVRTSRGTELATAIINVGSDGFWSISPEKLEEYINASGPDYPIYRHGKVLRIANAQDINDQMHLDISAKEKAEYCRQQVEELGLDMKIVLVEHLLGGERLIFYFTAQQRVDFRELVRRLASQYHTRIEMRQIGARDEARLIADYERCGRQCCCKEFLKLLRPVSMRMAKMQKATLDPAKISGQCGRLLCCLRYEDATYRELQERLPKKNTWVKTADGIIGKVVETQILTQLVQLSLPNEGVVVVPNEEIVERDIPAPEVEQEVQQEPIKPTPQPVLSWYAESSSSEEEYKDKLVAIEEGDTVIHQQETPQSQPTLEEKKLPTAQRRRKEKERKLSKKKSQPRRHPGALTIAPRLHDSESTKPSIKRRKKKKKRRQ